MKRVFSLFFILLLLVSFISAQIEDLENKFDELEEGLEKVRGVIEDPQGTTKDFLNKEWNNPAFSKFFSILDDFASNFNPLLSVVFGVEYSLSWVFFVSLSIWIFLFVLTYFAMKAIFNFNGLVNFGTGIVATIILVQIGSIDFILTIISPYLKNNLHTFIYLLILAIFIALYVHLMKNLEEYNKKTIKKEAEDQREMKSDFLEKIQDLRLKGMGID